MKTILILLVTSIMLNAQEDIKWYKSKENYIFRIEGDKATLYSYDVIEKDTINYIAKGTFKKENNEFRYTTTETSFDDDDDVIYIHIGYRSLWGEIDESMITCLATKDSYLGRADGIVFKRITSQNAAKLIEYYLKNN